MNKNLNAASNVDVALQVGNNGHFSFFCTPDCYIINWEFISCAQCDLDFLKVKGMGPLKLSG